jgi:hypothetical protein
MRVNVQIVLKLTLYRVWFDIYLLTVIGLTPGGSSTVHIYRTHKQYTERQNETEYTERNIHNNKNISTLQYEYITWEYIIYKN